MNLIEHRTIALAGVLQACKQVQNLARNGRSDAYRDRNCNVFGTSADCDHTPIYGGSVMGRNFAGALFGALSACSIRKGIKTWQPMMI